jgi:hypothetical protein
MRHLRPHLALLAMAALVCACSGPPGSSSGGESQGNEPSTGTEPSQAAASSGGGGGGGANGSVTYEITGDSEASGELPFQPLASAFDSNTKGWSAAFADTTDATTVVSLITFSQGQTFSFGDGTAAVVGVGESGAGSGCTFTLTKNDASGLSGHVECTSAGVVQQSGTGTAHLTADWDAHP